MTTPEQLAQQLQAALAQHTELQRNVQRLEQYNLRLRQEQQDCLAAIPALVDAHAPDCYFLASNAATCEADRAAGGPSGGEPTAPRARGEDQHRGGGGEQPADSGVPKTLYSVDLLNKMVYVLFIL